MWLRLPDRTLAADAAVEGVALDGLEAGFADQTFELFDGERFRGLRAGLVMDLLVAHRAVQVVGPVAQGDLRRGRAERNPVGLDVIEIVQQEAADGDGSQVVHRGRRTPDDAGQLRPLRMKRQRNEGLEAAGLVLKLAEPQHAAELGAMMPRSGGEIAIDISGAPIRNNLHDLMGVILVFRDITRRRRTERRSLTQYSVARLLAEVGRALATAGVAS